MKTLALILTLVCCGSVRGYDEKDKLSDGNYAIRDQYGNIVGQTAMWRVPKGWKGPDTETLKAGETLQIDNGEPPVTFDLYESKLRIKAEQVMMESGVSVEDEIKRISGRLDELLSMVVVFGVIAGVLFPVVIMIFCEANLDNGIYAKSVRPHLQDWLNRKCERWFGK